MHNERDGESERAVNRAWSAWRSNRALLLGFVSLLTDGCRVPSDWAGSAATLSPLLSPPLRRRVRHLLPLFADMALSHRSRRGRSAVPSRRSSGVRATTPAPTAAALAQVSSSPSFLYLRVLRCPLAPAPNPSTICDFSCSSLCLPAHPEPHRANRELRFSIVLYLVFRTSDLLSIDLICDFLLWLYRCRHLMASVTWDLEVVAEEGRWGACCIL